MLLATMEVRTKEKCVEVYEWCQPSLGDPSLVRAWKMSQNNFPFCCSNNSAAFRRRPPTCKHISRPVSLRVCRFPAEYLLGLGDLMIGRSGFEMLVEQPAKEKAPHTSPQIWTCER